MISIADFENDVQGRRFKDVLNDDRIQFQVVIDFFNDERRLLRMVESELHHDRPALAGVIKEFELVPEVNDFLSGWDAHLTTRFRQAVGVLVRLHMEESGWKKRGIKGSLGVRIKTKPGTTIPGSYYNKSGLSLWFTKSERYREPTKEEMKTKAVHTETEGDKNEVR